MVYDEDWRDDKGVPAMTITFTERELRQTTLRWLKLTDTSSASAPIRATEGQSCLSSNWNITHRKASV